MRQVSSLKVVGLFGYASHMVHFRTGSPTIITAPNGAGKTHVLVLLSAAMSLDFATLLGTNFRSLKIDLDDGRSLQVDREYMASAGWGLSIRAQKNGRMAGGALTITSAGLEDLVPKFPSYIKQVRTDRWFDGRTGRAYDLESMRQRFRTRSDPLADMMAEYPEILGICAPPRPVLIDTRRLDVSELSSSPEFGSATTVDNPAGAASRIHEYTEKLRAEVAEARRTSVLATQSADVSFAARALAAAKRSVKEAALHARYDETIERYETLAKNSLAVGEAPMDFPSETTPTVRRILSVFLDDWDKRLKPLLPVNEKLQTLREILDSKLAPSGKRTEMSARGNLEFFTFEGRRVRVSRLSSGEQHLVALFTMLLFSAQPGSLVLIDEPEISLHAAWKHAFLHDMARVAEISELQVVMATHSSAIVNGRWDLTEELVLAPGPMRAENSTPDEDVDDLDD